MKRRIISAVTALAIAAMANIPLPVLAAETAETVQSLRKAAEITVD